MNEIDQVVQGIIAAMTDPEWQARTLYFFLGLVIGKLIQYAIWPATKGAAQGTMWVSKRALSYTKRLASAAVVAVTPVPKLDKVAEKLQTLRESTGIDFRFLPTPTKMVLLGGDHDMDAEVKHPSQRSKVCEKLIDDMTEQVRISKM